MRIKVENLADRPVLLRLSSGDTLRLSPRDTSASLDEVDVRQNPKIAKLVANGVIKVHVPSKRATKTKTSKVRRPRVRGKKGGRSPQGPTP